MSNSFVSLSPPKQFVWGVTAKVIRRFRQQPEGGCIGKRKLHSSTTCRVLTRLACGRVMYENRFPSLHHQSGWGINRCSLWLCLRPNQTSHLHSCISYTIKSVLWGQGELARSIPHKVRLHRMCALGMEAACGQYLFGTGSRQPDPSSGERLSILDVVCNAR